MPLSADHKTTQRARRIHLPSAGSFSVVVSSSLNPRHPVHREVELSAGDLVFCKPLFVRIFALHILLL